MVHTAEEGHKIPVCNGSSEMFMQSALMKTKEIWQPLLATPAALKSRYRSSVEDTPFLRTALLSKGSRLSGEQQDFSRFVFNFTAYLFLSDDVTLIKHKSQQRKGF